jgi:hypothetical protein
MLQAGAASLDDVIEAGILLTNPADFAGLNEEYTPHKARPRSPGESALLRREFRMCGLGV